MPSSRVTLNTLHNGQPCTMDAAALTSVPRARRRNALPQLARRVRIAARARRISRASVGLRVEHAVRVDPSELDAATWLEWAEANLTPLELERTKRAAEADRSAQGAAIC